ncbi:hypothetical protein pipiens_015947 [Culex pipiens pipiens]|uniref:Uncharacterized protein n=1 Tax=Culex pipiens pipiens TaxID=38569 RepID=A0ABD1CNH0_CULPP
MLQISGAEEVKQIQVYDTEQIVDILDLQEVETSEEMEQLMMKIVDCNGMSLLTLLLHINYSCNDCEIFPKLQEVTTFTNQAPQIYNLWMSLDRQYHQLLQAFETNNCHAAVREVLIQIDPDYRQALINGQDPDYGSPLHYATASGDLDLVRTLLEFGADPNSMLDETGPLPRLRIETITGMADQDELIQNSMLLLGIRMKTLTSTQLDIIIEHGGNINTKDANDRNNTPLHVAACKGVPEIVQLLLDRGAKVSEKNSDGQTPLDVAQGSEVVEILKKNIQNVPKQELRPARDRSVAQQSTAENRTIFYPKRSGTSGFCGQLYETKLLTLILFRALKRKDIAEFYLGSNVDGLGALDDVVFWFRDIYGKTRMQFIQAKHRDDPDKDGKLTLGETLKEKGDYSIHNQRRPGIGPDTAGIRSGSQL